jgi:hypothetical protein
LLVRSRLEEARVKLDAARAVQTDIDAVQKTVQYVAARVQSGFGNYVGAIVTKAMHHVFHDRRKDAFVVRFRENRGKTECELLLRTEAGDEAHPFDCAGGGLWDTLSFALRPCVVVIEQPAPSRVLVLDEPFRNLHGSAGRRRALRMLYNTCVALDIQAVVVHQSDIGDASATDESLDVIAGEPGVIVYEVRKIGYEKSEVVRV